MNRTAPPPRNNEQPSNIRRSVGKNDPLVGISSPVKGTSAVGVADSVDSVVGVGVSSRVPDGVASPST